MSLLAVGTAAPAPAPEAPTPARTIIYSGMDVHKDSITIAVLPEGAKTPMRVDRFPNDLPKRKRWPGRVGREPSHVNA